MMSHVPYPQYVGIMVNGVTFFVLPALWLTAENCNISNEIQQSVGVQWAPAMTYSGTTYALRIEIPLGNILTNAELRTLKAFLKKSSETLASSGEEYDNIDYTEKIDPSEVGKLITPWRKRDEPLDEQALQEPAPNNWKGQMLDYLEDGRRAAITGFIGVSHQCMGGYLSGFRSDTNVAQMKEVWSISIDAINISVIRKGPPDPPEVPEIPSDAPASGYRPNHNLRPQELTPS